MNSSRKIIYGCGGGANNPHQIGDKILLQRLDRKSFRKEDVEVSIERHFERFPGAACALMQVEFDELELLTNDPAGGKILAKEMRYGPEAINVELGYARNEATYSQRQVDYYAKCRDRALERVAELETKLATQEPA